MKKTKLVLPILTTSIVSVAPFMTLTSCSEATKEEEHFNFIEESSDPKTFEFTKNTLLAHEFVYKFKYVPAAGEVLSEKTLKDITTTASITSSNSYFNVSQCWTEYDTTEYIYTVHLDVVVLRGVFSAKNDKGELAGKQELILDLKLTNGTWTQTVKGLDYFAVPVDK